MRVGVCDGHREMHRLHDVLQFLSDPGIPGPIYGSGCLKLSHLPFLNVTDVSLADEDTTSILTNIAN